MRGGAGAAGLPAGVLAGLVAGLLTGCAGEPGAPAWAAADSAGVRIVTNAPGAEGPAEWHLSAEPILDLGSVDVGGPTEFFRVREARLLPGDGLVVANQGSEELRYFTLAGEHVRTVGGRGGGPGEFRGLSFVRPFTDSLLTFDGGNGRFSVFDADGRVSRTFRLEGREGLLVPVALVDDAVLAFAGSPMSALPREGINVDTVWVSAHDMEGGLRDSIARLPHNVRFVRREGDRQTTLSAPFVAWGAFAALGGRLCHAFGTAAEIRCYEADGRLVRIWRVEVEPETVAPEDVADFWTRQVEAAQPERRAALRRLRAALPFPERLSAFDALIGDDAGRLWARRYAPVEEAERVWWIFEEGRWVGRLRVPPTTRLFDVREGRALAVALDSLRIEHVRVYGIEAPPAG